MEENKLNLGSVGKKRISILRGRSQKIKDGDYAILAEAEIGITCFALCPVCQKPVVLHPTKRVNKETCKVCGTIIRYCAKGTEISSDTTEKEEAGSKGEPVQNKTKSEPQSQSLPTQLNRQTETPPRAQLVWGSIFNRKSYELKLGENIVGRDDDEEPSDVQIHDDFVSRRSVKIEPISGPSGYTFKMTVLNAMNPVMVRNVSQSVGTVLYLNYGDTFVLGKTTITLKKMKK